MHSLWRQRAACKSSVFDGKTWRCVSQRGVTESPFFLLVIRDLLYRWVRFMKKAKKSRYTAFLIFNVKLFRWWCMLDSDNDDDSNFDKVLFLLGLSRFQMRNRYSTYPPPFDCPFPPPPIHTFLPFPRSANLPICFPSFLLFVFPPLSHHPFPNTIFQVSFSFNPKVQCTSHSQPSFIPYYFSLYTLFYPPPEMRKLFKKSATCASRKCAIFLH